MVLFFFYCIDLLLLIILLSGFLNYKFLVANKWSYVCDDNESFAQPEADVVCRELGFKQGAHEIRTDFSSNPENNHNKLDSFITNQIECHGNESSLRDCNFMHQKNLRNNCPVEKTVGVVCKMSKLKCPDNYWLCGSQECIPTAFVCDLTIDCEDGSDESKQICNVIKIFINFN